MLCATLHCSMSAAACVARQDARTRAGGRDVKPLHLEMCDEARCSQAAGARAEAALEPVKKPLVRVGWQAAKPREEIPMSKVCKCGKKLRSSSVGETCFRCRVEAGETVLIKKDRPERRIEQGEAVFCAPAPAKPLTYRAPDGSDGDLLAMLQARRDAYASKVSALDAAIAAIGWKEVA